MKKYFFFGSFLSAQEKWLNKMVSQGYRLVRTEKLMYEFEKCKPNEFQYHVEFIGEKSKAHAEEYKRFLEDEMGYRVMYKNINLNYSIGKVRYRPWAEKGGRIATNSTTFNRELLIVEKGNDEKPFELHTSYDDMISYYKTLQKPWLYMLIIFGILGIIMRAAAGVIFAAASLVPVLIYNTLISKIKREATTKESE